MHPSATGSGCTTCSLVRFADMPDDDDDNTTLDEVRTIVGELSMSDVVPGPATESR